MLRSFLAWGAGVSFLLLVLGHLGALHPVGDTIAIGGPIFAATALGAGLLLKSRAGVICAALSSVWLVVWGVQMLIPSGPAGDFVIYQKNILHGNHHETELAEDILASGADVVTLQEVADENAGLYDLLAAEFPHRHICNYGRRYNVAVVSRHPIVPGTEFCSASRGLATVVIDRNGQQVSVGSIHLFRPFPDAQSEQLAAIEPFLAEMARPTVIGGDFNMHPRTRVTRRVAHLTDTRELRQLKPTLYVRGLVPVYLDHILAPSGQVERRPYLGSDHFGLLGRVEL